MKFKIFQIPSVYTIWDGLSLKTISRYATVPLKPVEGQQKNQKHFVRSSNMYCLFSKTHWRKVDNLL